MGKETISLFIAKRLKFFELQKNWKILSFWSIDSANIKRTRNIWPSLKPVALWLKPVAETECFPGYVRHGKSVTGLLIVLFWSYSESSSKRAVQISRVFVDFSCSNSYYLRICPRIFLERPFSAILFKRQKSTHETKTVLCSIPCIIVLEY